ncbi:MAG TPA: UDP-N-acetylglucosamine-1-phosphate transferase [Candidatus Nitrosotenuis sp.]|nr:UDP-N-acetylglucosamine-1-phosphate transferase [Candidatus Nitrosotenuis sp.]HIH45919.1 UDP-N-acetylglucosamine-1-phosphate transferase [Candidatus Nitrosotenuis sp.]HIH68556.1 UDP-N-acetylglucosamine-1-phosphate transferase [Candidatus Nitrosotenuis sp.]HII04122.1 UDP-N-acetylglucosamine-1-phosphate transferase [Candidatus Nitrosotenuis sp.]
MQDYIVGAVVASAIAFFVVFGLVPPLIKMLTKKNWMVKDVNRIGGAMIPRPGGPVILAGIIASEISLYFLLPQHTFTTKAIIALLITTSIGFIVGFIDDRKVMGGWFKPVALIAAAIPIILLGAYEPNLVFPLFGEVKIPALYLGLILIMIPITGNTINSIDVMNGIASGFMTIATFSLAIALFILQNYSIAILTLPLAFASLAFFRYHNFPAKIFPGDSGAITLGAAYGAIAIIGHVEVIAAIALLPAIINSFLFLSSVKRIVEHRQVKGPTVHTDDHKITATKEIDAPITLVRLIVAAKPLTEKQIGNTIFKLAIFSGILAIITALVSGFRI